jgi:vanillate O-demethylase ferredoxin subunit
MPDNLQSGTLPVRVSRKTVEAADIVSCEFVAPHGEYLPPFSAGSHIDVHLPNGHVRQYSLCNSPSERHRYQICVQRVASGAGGSIAMHDLVVEGDRLTISPPRNHFPLASPSGRSILLAGGIGITPIISMAEHLHGGGSDFELVYCARSRAQTAFYERLRRAPFADKVRFYTGDSGDARLSRLDLDAFFSGRPRESHVYICGSPRFVDAALNASRGAGWDAAALHHECFGPLSPAQDQRTFEVQIASTGKIIAVPSGKSISQALAESGLQAPTSCGQGICGTCLTGVLEGKVDHRDYVLSEEERARHDQMALCCSRAHSARLVLDL